MSIAKIYRPLLLGESICWKLLLNGYTDWDKTKAMQIKLLDGDLRSATNSKSSEVIDCPEIWTNQGKLIPWNWIGAVSVSIWTSLSLSLSLEKVSQYIMEGREDKKEEVIPGNGWFWIHNLLCRLNKGKFVGGEWVLVFPNMYIYRDTYYGMASWLQWRWIGLWN